VIPGIDRLLSDRVDLLANGRVGLICNASSVTSQLAHAADCFAQHPDIQLVRLFGPEHGLRGDAQDMIAVEGQSVDRQTGVAVHSLYGTQVESLRPAQALVEDLDVLVFDIQDVGARYYTYVYTMAFCMEAAGRAGIPMVVCDRPNPIGGIEVEGNAVQSGYDSFVGQFPIANRHGMTAGELARFFAAECAIDCELHVVEMSGWERSMTFHETGLPWVQPSPNMPTEDTALVYPGMCLFEGTLLSEGRGCTRPFEVVGAPYVDGAAWARETTRELEAAGYAGFGLRSLVFLPTFHKHAGIPCGGVQVHVTDRERFRPLMVATALLKTAWRLWPDEVLWRTEEYEFVTEPIAIDLLGGTDALRHEIEGDVSLATIQERWNEQCRDFLAQRRRYLMY